MSYAELTLAPVLEEFSRRAEPVTYNGSALTAIFRLVGLESRSNTTTGTTNANKATILVLKKDVVDPTYNDTVVVKGETWRVLFREAKGGLHTHKLAIERSRGRVV